MPKSRKLRAPNRAATRTRAARTRRESPRYTVIYEPQPEGGYTVSVPALPGCVTEGETLAEARAMALDAIRGYCESLLVDGFALPADIARPPKHERLVVALSAR